MTNEHASLKNLQTALSMELAAAQQYLLHAHVLDDWGLDKLADQMREEMQEELGHAGMFIDRILFLGGDPSVTPEKAPVRAKSLKEMFEIDKADEKEAITFYTRAPARPMRPTISAARLCSKRSRWMKRGTGAGSTCSSTCWSGWVNRPSSRNT